jgi:hypothetical protein
MNDPRKDECGPLMAWQSFMPLRDTVQHEEDLQGTLRAEMRLFDEAEKKAKDWMDRRQFAVESGLKALGEMSACKDPVSAAAIYGRWFIGSLNGIVADLKDAQDFTIKVTAIGESSARAMVEGFLIDPISRA